MYLPNASIVIVTLPAHLNGTLPPIAWLKCSEARTSQAPAVMWAGLQKQTTNSGPLASSFSWGLPFGTVRIRGIPASFRSLHGGLVRGRNMMMLVRRCKGRTNYLGPNSPKQIRSKLSKSRTIDLYLRPATPKQGTRDLALSILLCLVCFRAHALV